MISVLLTLLKIIGIVLLSLLGLFLVLLLIVLFVPVRYRIKGYYKDEFVCHGKIIWLLHLVSVSIDYDKEAATHMAVAALVASEEIDAGMGIRSAADAMGLDFIEVGVEEYDFAIARENLQLNQVQEFLEILRSGTFHKKLEEMGGYGWHQAGRIEMID